MFQRVSAHPTDSVYIKGIIFRRLLHRNGWHNGTMVWSAGDLGLEIDFGQHNPGAIFQRKEKGYWHGYLVDGKPVTNPYDLESLPPGWYRLREPAVDCTHLYWPTSDYTDNVRFQ